MGNRCKDTVLLNIEHNKNIMSELELLEILAEAENDAQNGNVAPILETFDSIREKLN